MSLPDAVSAVRTVTSRPHAAQYTQPISPDLKPLRQQQIDFLTMLLKPGGYEKLSETFGNLGSPTSALQRQAGDAIGAYLRQPAPEQRALDTSLPALQAILDGKPGQGVIEALQPTFQRNLSLANQQGGRFGSANAILRSNAVNDFNLLGAQAAQQGQQTQLQAAQMLSLLANAAGQNPFARLTGAYGIGQQDAAQADLETQRRLQLLMALLGTAQGAAFNVPYAQTTPYQPPIWEQLLPLVGTVAGGGQGA